MWINRATSEPKGLGVTAWHSSHPAPAFYQKKTEKAANDSKGCRAKCNPLLARRAKFSQNIISFLKNHTGGVTQPRDMKENPSNKAEKRPTTEGHQLVRCDTLRKRNERLTGKGQENV